MVLEQKWCRDKVRSSPTRRGESPKLLEIICNQSVVPNGSGTMADVMGWG